MMRRITLSLAAVVLAGCGGGPPAAEKRGDAPARPAVPVTGAAVERTAVDSVYEATGTVRARTSATVAAKLMGYATEVRASVGDRVGAGQTLVVLDARDQQAAIQRAEAAREEVRSGFAEAESGIAAAQSQADLARATHTRIQDLFNKRSATNQELDEALARWKAARAALDMARARRKQLDSKLAQVEQEVRAAGIQRTYTEVAAPFAGVILTRTIEPGVLAVPGAPLFTMEQEGAGALRFEANVEESRFGSIRLGQVVAVSAGGVLDKVNLRVAEIVPVVDPVSRTGIVKIDLPARAGLRSGMFGRAEFASGGSREALTIPATAVIERGQLQSVFAIDGQVARLRLVTLGDAGKQRVEVLSGLQAGERVVSPVPGGLTDGARVEVSR